MVSTKWITTNGIGQITDKVMSDVMDRSDDDDAPIILFGTMYNQYDYQNTFVDAWEKGRLEKLKKFKFIRVTPDGRNAFALLTLKTQMEIVLHPNFIRIKSWSKNERTLKIVASRMFTI